MSSQATIEETSSGQQEPARSGLLYLPDVLELVPFKRSKLLQLEKEGLFPMHGKIGSRNVWRLWEIEHWVENWNGNT